MKLDELVRDTLQGWPQEGVRPPSDLADQVLRGRRRRTVRNLAAVSVATAAVVATVAVQALTDGGDGVRPAGRSVAVDVLAHPDQSPPRELIAAGDTAVSGFFAFRKFNGDNVLTRTWALHNPATGRYEKTRWAWLDVAPGMKTAAVLEGELPARRIGILDTATGEVTRWIPVHRGVASVEWSPDGRRLLATTYGQNPDRLTRDHSVFTSGKPSRTGFYVVDVASGHARWSKLASGVDKMDGLNAREDIRWSQDGSLVWAPSKFAPGRVFHDLDGRKVPAPKAERYMGYPWAGLSPDGRYVAGGSADKEGGINSQVLDARTGEPVRVVPAQQLLAWADTSHLIVWGCDPKPCSGKGESPNQLLLVSLNSKKVIPLSGFRGGSDDRLSLWTPVFSKR